MTNDKPHWSDSDEKIGGYYGIRLMLLFYDYGGRIIFQIMLYPVIFFYYLFSRKQRKISQDFLALVQRERASKGLEPVHYSSFRHFLAFGTMLMDKINAWRGKLKLYRDIVFMEDAEKTIYAYEKEHRGRILLCSHLGNVDALRALIHGAKIKAPEIYSIFFTKNARNFNGLLKAVCKNADMNIIATDAIGPATAIKLSEVIDNNGMIAIVGDRTPVRGHNADHDGGPESLGQGPSRVCEVNFLGRKAKLPQGAFILAALLKCPMQCVFALKNEKTNKIEIYCRNMFNEIKLPHKNKEETLKAYIQQYANILEDYTLRYPYQWFNFFDFFSK